MANCKIKEEFNSAHAAELNEPGTFDQTVNCESNMLPNTAPDLLVNADLGQEQLSNREVNKPLWQNCEDLERLQQIEVKERAVDDSLACMDRIEKILHSTTGIKSLARHIAAIEKIRENHKKCRLLVGFLGVSGAGKSSLINVLLEHEDLLPADDEKACTASVVEISFNAELEYEAVVERIDKEDWQSELNQLFKDLDDREKVATCEDEEPDLEREYRIKTAFSKIKCVYPEIKNPKDLQDYTAKGLLSHPNVKGILGKDHQIIHKNRDKFAAEIRPFIASGATNGGLGKTYAQWPLVKLVRLRIPAPLLEHGLVLVDLPGSADSNVARGIIAEKYQKNLKVTCVVAPATRAATDKPAQDLLGKALQLSLQLDNRFSTENLCFIVTKTDASINVKRYLQQNPDVEAAIAGELQLHKDYSENLNTWKIYFGEAQATSRSETELGKSLRKEHKQASRALGALRGKSSKKRKRNDEAEASAVTLHGVPGKPEEQAMRNNLMELEARIAAHEKQAARTARFLVKSNEHIETLQYNLEVLESRQKGACINKRNETSTFELRQDFESVPNPLSPAAGSLLQVFCVSSTAHSLWRTSSDLVPGFPKRSDTGISKLRRWMTKTTLDTRNDNAVAFLESFKHFQISMGPWLSDSSIDSKLNGAEKEAICRDFESALQDLIKHFQIVLQDLIDSCEELIAGDFSDAMEEIERKGVSTVQLTVNRWAQKPVHWASHRACNRALGTWTTSGGLQLSWCDDLVGIYLEPLTNQWLKTIHKAIPALKGGYDSKVAECIESFVTALQQRILVPYPQLYDAFQDLKESTLRTPAALEKNSARIFAETIQEGAREAHRKVKPVVRTVWDNTFVLCGEQYGRGHFKRNIDTHNEHAKQSSDRMLKKCSLAIREDLSQVWASLPDEFAKGTDPVIEQARAEFEELTLNCTKEECKSEEERLRSHLEVEVKRNVRRCFEELMIAWEAPLDGPEEEEDEVELIPRQYEMPDDPTKIDDTSDEDYSDGSGVGDDSDG
ncbi:P-loop containing nucleoside triphosphate hydrolase [Glarea lozoyensis ATCC 20868]|uniref:p-loop containing nucleoside triphosphate hydrolase n=1 Tax=Glarea lozoyensis (strain ATCC 20868 / MF5171) TaxID=1116229 RepID=S3DSJ3_GLAL2|nr:P-loop containing nucleoside triphosphate hydrolase [Glarea lozoyensis ATCC 20868]EPE29393.1 P-loop containing nucleoside triphosphate hydrolase [Glarea lozoyensis ATCC 20868]